MRLKWRITIACVLTSLMSSAAGWIQVSDFGGTARHRTTMLTLGNKVYTGLGHFNGAGPNVLFDDWWEYDPATNAWAQKADYLGGPCYHAAGFAINDIGYVGTGRVTSTALVQDFFKYDPTTNAWTQLTDFPGTGRRGAVGFAIDGYGYIAAGTNASDMYRYNPTTDSWTSAATLPGGSRISAVGFELNGFAYMGTGYTSSAGWSTTDFYKYNPTADTWTPIADVGIDPIEGPIPRMEACAFSVNEKGYVLTGDNISSGTNYKDMWELDPATDTWTRIEDFDGTARRYMSATTLNGVAYTGLGTNGTNFKDFWRYDPTLALLENQLELVDANVFPNPASESVQFEFTQLPTAAIGKVSISLFDLFGQQIAEKTIDTENTRFDLKQYTSGLYLYTISYESQRLKTGKFSVL